MKLRDPEPHRVILATLDGDSLTAKHRESQLKDTSTIWRDVRTHQFVNTRDSAWSILDTILNIDPIKLQYIQDELMVCTTLRTRTRLVMCWAWAQAHRPARPSPKKAQPSPAQL